MKKQSIPLPVSGWFEVLYRREACLPPTNISQICPVDYELMDHAFPLSEFERIFDVVDMFLSVRPNVRREIREFDAISLFRSSPTKGSATLLLIEPTKLRLFGHDGGQYHFATFTNLILVPVKPEHRFAPFRNG